MSWVLQNQTFTQKANLENWFVTVYSTSNKSIPNVGIVTSEWQEGGWKGTKNMKQSSLF